MFDDCWFLSGNLIIGIMPAAKLKEYENGQYFKNCNPK